MGPMMVFSSSGSPTLSAPRALGKLFRKIRVNRPLHQDARSGGAALPIVGEDHEQCGIQRTRDIGVVEHHEGALAAQLHRELLQARRLDDAVADDSRTGEGDRAHVGVPAQRLARLRTIAVDDIEHAGGDSRLQGELPETGRGERGQFAHLQHRGIAERERGRHFPGRGHERHVPRRDQRANPHRVEQRVVEVRRRWVRVPVHAHAHLGEVVEVVGRARHELLGRL